MSATMPVGHAHWLGGWQEHGVRDECGRNVRAGPWTSTASSLDMPTLTPCLPMGLLQVLRIQPSVEFELMLPYDSDSYDTLEIITNKFGGPGNGAACPSPSLR